MRAWTASVPSAAKSVSSVVQTAPQLLTLCRRFSMRCCVRPGQPLDARSRAFMEPRLGHNFSNVRVHTDSRAAESARAVNARAYTVGRDVVFDANQYAPHSNEGRKLLAHELTHVVQQKNNSMTGSAALELGAPVDGFERQADTMADQIAKPRFCALNAFAELSRRVCSVIWHWNQLWFPMRNRN